MDAGSKCEAIVRPSELIFPCAWRSTRQCEEASQLRLAFGSRRGAEMALRYVRDARIELVVDLLPEFEMAMTTNSQVLLTREVSHVLILEPSALSPARRLND